MYPQDHDAIEMVAYNRIREEMNRAAAHRQIQELRSQQQGPSCSFVCTQLSRLGHLLIVMGQRLESLGPKPTAELSCSDNLHTLNA